MGLAGQIDNVIAITGIDDFNIFKAHVIGNRRFNDRFIGNRLHIEVAAVTANRAIGIRFGLERNIAEINRCTRCVSDRNGRASDTIGAIGYRTVIKNARTDKVSVGIKGLPGRCLAAMLIAIEGRELNIRAAGIIAKINNNRLAVARWRIMIDFATGNLTTAIAKTGTKEPDGVIRSRQIKLAIFINKRRSEIKGIQVGIRPGRFDSRRRTAARQAKCSGFKRCVCFAQFGAIKNQRIITTGQVQRVIAIPADKGVITDILATDVGNITGASNARAAVMGGFRIGRGNIVGIEFKGVITRSAIKRIVTFATRKRVIAVTTGNGIVARATDQGVIAAITGNRVIASKTVNAVIAARAAQIVVFRCADVGHTFKLIRAKLIKRHTHQRHGTARRQIDYRVAIAIIGQKRLKVSPGINAKIRQ